MAGPSPLRMHRHDQAVTFRAEGRATMHHGLALRRAAEGAWAEGAADVRVDLRGCTYMDSTFLGTLLFLLRTTARRPAGHFALVAPSEACVRLIDQTGLTAVYPVEPAADEPGGDWEDVPVERDDQAGVCRHVLKAHQELATVPGPVGETFGRVARCLEREAGEGPAPDAG